MNNGEQKKFLQNSTEKKSEIPAENQNNQNSNQNQNPLPVDPAPLNIPTTLKHPIEASTPIVELPHCSYLHDMLPEPETNTGHGFQARQETGA